MVAWDAGREAARAVADAMAMLVAAEQVQVVIVNPKRGATAHGDEPGADIATHLAPHGIKVELQVETQRNLSVGDTRLPRIGATPSEERRDGNERVRPIRLRESPQHEKKQIK